MQQLKQMRQDRKHHALGVALLDALFAWVVLSLGVLGLLWMHQQALSQQRQQLMRAVASDLAEDLAERMRLNAPQRALYAKSWGYANTVAPNCMTNACTRQELTMWDQQQLQQVLQDQLPEGDVAVFALTNVPDWWGIVVGWRDTNQTYVTDATAGTPPCPAQMSCWRLFFKPLR